MNYRSQVMVAWLMVLASGCASSSRELSGSNPSAKMGKSYNHGDDEYEVVCEVERTVGSWIPEEVCRSVEKTEMTRRRTQDLLNVTRGIPVPPSGRTGGN
jgi:hypothetical protein